MSGTVGDATDNGSPTRTDPSGLRGLSERRSPNVLTAAPPAGRPSTTVVSVVVIVAFLLVIGGALAIGRGMVSEPAATGAPAEPRCWNGTVQMAGTCPALQGEQALRWIFPVAPPFTTCKGYEPQGGGEMETVQCEWADLTAVVYLSRWDRTVSVDEYANKNFRVDSSLGPVAGTRVWQTDTLDGDAGPGYLLSYDNYPFSVLVLGPVAERDAAIDRLRPTSAQGLEYQQ